MLNFVY